MKNRLVEGLVDELAKSVGTDQAAAFEALTYLSHHGYLRDPGTEVEPDHIRNGDRYRVEYESVRPTMEYVFSARDVTQKTVRIRYSIEKLEDGLGVRPWRYSSERIENVKYFLLERAKPALPDAPGTIAKFRARRTPPQTVQAVLGSDGKWYGPDVCLDAEAMADRYELVEVVG